MDGGLPAGLGLGGEALDVAALLLTRLLREQADEGKLALSEGGETGLDLLDAGEVEDALRAGTNLAGGLRAAQEEDGHHGDVAVIQLEMLGEVVAVFLDAVAGAENDGDEFFLAKVIDAVLDGALVVGGDGVAIGGLIAGEDEAIEGEGVILGGGALLLEEAAEDAGFDGGEIEGHGSGL